MGEQAESEAHAAHTNMLDWLELFQAMVERVRGQPSPEQAKADMEEITQGVQKIMRDLRAPERFQPRLQPHRPRPIGERRP